MKIDDFINNDYETLNELASIKALCKDFEKDNIKIKTKDEKVFINNIKNQ